MQSAERRARSPGVFVSEGELRASIALHDVIAAAGAVGRGFTPAAEKCDCPVSPQPRLRELIMNVVFFAVRCVAGAYGSLGVDVPNSGTASPV